MKFSSYFIDRPVLASVLSSFILIAGLISLFKLPISEYPEVVPPSVVVRAAYPGANPKVISETVAAPLEQEIVGVKMDIQIGGNPITFDSTKDSPAANPLSDFFKALVGSEFTLTVSPDFKVTKIEGRDEFLKKLVTANQQMEPMLKQILSDEALKQMADPAFSVVPNKPETFALTRVVCREASNS